MPGVRVDVKCGRVRYVTASFIGNDCNVIADLILIWIAFEWVKWITDCYVRRPGNASVGAEGIEQLRVSVVGSIARVVPNSIQAAIGGY